MGLLDKIDVESLAKNKAEEILKTKGIEVECPFCKQAFTARKINETCPHCGKTLDIEFNVR